MLKFVVMIEMNFNGGNGGNVIPIVNLVEFIMVVINFYGGSGCGKISAVNLVVGGEIYGGGDVNLVIMATMVVV